MRKKHVSQLDIIFFQSNDRHLIAKKLLSLALRDAGISPAQWMPATSVIKTSGARPRGRHMPPPPVYATDRRQTQTRIIA